RAINCGKLGGMIGRLMRALGDVARDHHDAGGLALTVENGVIGGLQPDLLAVLAEAPDFARAMLALAQRGPKLARLDAVLLFRVQKDGAGLALHLIEAIAGQRQETLIRIAHRAVERKLDDRMGAAQRLELRRNGGVTL